ncbi:MAG TPA: ribosomal protein S18-alanine N-acetyltransferase [Acidimicrobiales bacterium]|nr:ribosomal protein S18-alanine N-acetyltransferase [Acidimicrobiales bacterium]
MAVRIPEPGPPEPVPDGDLQVQLVPMRRRHLRSVLRIEGQVYPRPWSLSLFVSELALRSTRAYYVARVGGIVVGYCGVMLAGDDAHITTIAVDPAWHRRGIGTRLLLNAARVAVGRSAKHLTLEVRVTNAPAQALYRAFGFHPAGVRKGYYVETNEDALVMWAEDIDSPDYADRLAALEAAVPGTTVIEELK